MPGRIYPFLDGGTCHLYHRGHNRQAVFRCGSDDRACRTGLRGQLGAAPAGRHATPGARRPAYSLMPNHDHLLVQPLDDTLPARMPRRPISFTRAGSAKYGRVGALFQGLFLAVAAEDDEPLPHQSACIHLHPVEAGLARPARDWESASCRETLGLRSGTLPGPDLVLHVRGGRQAYGRLPEARPDGMPARMEHLLQED